MNKWFVIAAAVVFSTIFVGQGINEQRRQERLERVQVECVKHHSAHECQELR